MSECSMRPRTPPVRSATCWSHPIERVRPRVLLRPSPTRSPSSPDPGPGPVHIEVPLDVLEGAWNGTTAAPDSPPPSRSRLDACRHPCRRGGGRFRSPAHRRRWWGTERNCRDQNFRRGSSTRPSRRLPTERASSLTKLIRCHSAPMFACPPSSTSRATPTCSSSSGPKSPTPICGVASSATRSMAGIRDENSSQMVIRCDIDPDQLGKNLGGRHPRL